MKWFKNGEKLYYTALKYIDQGNEKRAIDYLYAASEKKYVEAKCVLAFHELFDFDSKEWNIFLSLSLIDKIVFIADNFLSVDNIIKADRWYRFAIKRGADNIWSILGDAYEARKLWEEAISCYMNGVKEQDAYCAYKAARIANTHPYSVHHITIEEKVDLYFYAAKGDVKEAYEPVASFFEDGVTVDVSKKLAIYWNEKAAEFSVQAQFKLGELLKYDQPRKSRYWFLKAAKSGNHQASLEIAKEHIERNEIVDAREILSPIIDNADEHIIYLYSTLVEEEEREKYLLMASDKKSTDAYFDLYTIYLNHGNINKAYDYLDLAVDAHHVKALFHQGRRYAKMKDWDKAYMYFSKASIRSDKEALRMMAKYYWIGRGVEVDKNQALLYLRRATSEEDQLSRYILALLYLKGKLVVQNPMQSKTLFSQVKEKWEKYALFHLGLLYLSEDAEESKRCFERALSCGNSGAAWHLGYGHETNQWRISRMSEAVLNYRIAAHNGYPESFNNIGVIYHHGKDGIIDLDRAETNYLNAIDHSVIHAYYNYAVLLLQLPTFESDEKAIDLLKVAVDREFVPAMVLLGRLHIENQTINADKKEGILLLKRASDLGDVDAKDLLLETLG
ncbi:hypothetical protein K5X82_11825 [Halosquirtibacter xylanolyticus]|uniref:tetratricopeptide repeat protein n=1 Tax=Halosquirtibacter xylanolyticus TaxID=3374599 RepID=UPI0037479472|nr:hypothetical protein K5X82_11825 [Prolixibacteraceae bacterium]